MYTTNYTVLPYTQSWLLYFAASSPCTGSQYMQYYQSSYPKLPYNPMCLYMGDENTPSDWHQSQVSIFCSPLCTYMFCTSSTMTIHSKLCMLKIVYSPATIATPPFVFCCLLSPVYTQVVATVSATKDTLCVRHATSLPWNHCTFII